MWKLCATERPYTVHGPGLSAGRTARNDKNDNKFALLLLSVVINLYCIFTQKCVLTLFINPWGEICVQK